MEEREYRIRPMVEADLPEVEKIFRLALGSFVGLPRPEEFSGDASIPRCRFLTHPQGTLVCEREGEIVGSNFLSSWGSFGLFGPLSVKPGLQNQGAGKALLERTLPLFAECGIRQKGIFTFPHSAKHLALYARYGFFPQTLNLVLARDLKGQPPPLTPPELLASLPPSERGEAIALCRLLCERIYPGLDLSREIESVERHGWGDTILLREGSALKGFALCHRGAGTEAGSGVLYVKFGAADGPESFAALLQRVFQLAALKGTVKVVTGVNLSREGVYRTLMGRGFRIEVIGVAMQSPNLPGFNRRDVWVMDDWR